MYTTLHNYIKIVYTEKNSEVYHHQLSENIIFEEPTLEHFLAFEKNLDIQL